MPTIEAELAPRSSRAPAKVNLSLSVGPPLASGPQIGFHPIASWFSCIELWDDVFAEQRDGRHSEYEVTWADDAPRPTPIDWSLDKDLAVRAHRLMEEAHGGPLPVSLRVRKRIPVGGGLGGGSADAAATLLAVRDLFNLDWPLERLKHLSTRLGSDVAFFLDDAIGGGRSAGPSGNTSTPRPALVSGLGDRIERVPTLSWPLVLIFPPFGCPTGPVYKAYDRHPVPLREADIANMVRSMLHAGRLDPNQLFNDLAEPACVVQPRLREVMQQLRDHSGRTVHVTGSGSTLFILGASSEDHSATTALAQSLQREYPDLAMVATRLI